MSKNIIICADGTGNSGGTGEVTNVWRLYEAIALQDPGQPQVAKHDDGVGTQSIRFIGVLGLGLGLGLSRNLSELYRYLMRTFDEGDRIYLFGFSRGAFTVRTLANILYFCGLADRCDEHGELLSPERIDELADQAVAAHRSRDWTDPDNPQTAAFQFRTAHGLRHQGAPPGRLSDYEKTLRGRFPIEFLGVWDTVDAVGLPFDEMTQYCLRQVSRQSIVARLLQLEKFFGHVLRRSGPTAVDGDGWEDDGSHQLIGLPHAHGDEGSAGSTEPFIRRICHAIALDDERYTFHPTLFLEHRPGCTRSGTPIEQVWFPGVHANVGGGYPKDGLAYVSLNWMMHHAAHAGLKFNRETWQTYQLLADPDGPLYDSRAGFGRFYRYRPRHLEMLCRDAGLVEAGGHVNPTLHPSVLARLQSRAGGYAPTGVPEQYTVAAATEFQRPVSCREHPDRVHRRMETQQNTENLIWWRRGLYYLFVVWILAWVGVNFASETVLGSIESCVRWIDRQGFRHLTSVWYGFTLVSCVVAGVCHWRSVVAGRSRQLSTVQRTRRQFFWATFRNLTVGILVLLALHEPVTLLLDWSLPAVLSPLVELLEVSPLVVLILFSGSYLLERSSAALIQAISSNQSAAWDASLLKETAADLTARSRPIRWLYRTAGRHLQARRHHKALWLKRQAGPFCVFWGVLLVLTIGLLTSASSVIVRFRTAGERFVRTSDSLDSLASIYPHGRIAFDHHETIEFVTDAGSMSSLELEQGRFYLLLAVPQDWDQPDADPSTGNAGELPGELRGRLAGSAAEASADAAKLWKWNDGGMPATPEGTVESEINLWERLLLKLAAPYRPSAALPWFQLMGHVENAPHLLIPAGNSVVFQAPATGRLKLYVNDLPNDYHDNQGKALIRLYTCRQIPGRVARRK